jgi:hypothetical protein
VDAAQIEAIFRRELNTAYTFSAAIGGVLIRQINPRLKSLEEWLTEHKNELLPS